MHERTIPTLKGSPPRITAGVTLAGRRLQGERRVTFHASALLMLVATLVGSPAAAVAAQGQPQTELVEGVVQEMVVENAGHHPHHTEGEAQVERVLATEEGMTALPPSVVPHAKGGDVLAAQVVEASDGSQTVVSATVTEPERAAVEGSAAALAAAPARKVFVALVVPPGVPESANQNTVESVSALLSEADSFWADQTGGAVRFAVAASLPVYTSAHHCGDRTGMVNEATDRFAAAGHTAQGIQRHLLLVLPNFSDGVHTGCPSGVATVGSPTAVNNTVIVSNDHSGLYTHEFGHNLGLWHSDALVCDNAQDATPVAVTPWLIWPSHCWEAPAGDAMDVMGDIRSNGGEGSLNAAHLSHLGHTPYALHDVTTVGVTSVTIAPLSDTASVRGLRIADARGRYYFVEYRTATGRDAFSGRPFVPAQLGVRILRDNPVWRTGSYVLDSTPADQQAHHHALPPGQTFTSADGSVAVKLVEANDDGATLHVAYSAPMGSPTNCVVALPTGFIATAPCSGAATTPTPLPMLRPETTNALAPGQRLTAGQQLVSPSGAYRAVMQADGNFVVYAGSRIAWHARTNGKFGARLIMQGDGNLVVYSLDDRPLWHTHTNGQGSARLVLHDDGSLVVYRPDNRPLWSSVAGRPATSPSTPTGSTMNRGQQMAAGQQLTSSDGRYRFVMQSDGNAVVYTGSRAIWSTRTNGHPGARIVLQSDGNLVLYSPADRALWHTSTNAGGRFVMQHDGNLVLYSAADRALWYSGVHRG